MSVWEIIYSSGKKGKNDSTSRMRVPGGWLYRNVIIVTIDNPYNANQEKVVSESMCFVPDVLGTTAGKDNQWQKLTSDPATWPDSDLRVHFGRHTTDGWQESGERRGSEARERSKSWTHWWECGRKPDTTTNIEVVEPLPFNGHGNFDLDKDEEKDQFIGPLCVWCHKKHLGIYCSKRGRYI